MPLTIKSQVLVIQNQPCQCSSIIYIGFVMIGARISSNVSGQDGVNADYYTVCSFISSEDHIS